MQLEIPFEIPHLWLLKNLRKAHFPSLTPAVPLLTRKIIQQNINVFLAVITAVLFWRQLFAGLCGFSSFWQRSAFLRGLRLLLFEWVSQHQVRRSDRTISSPRDACVGCNGMFVGCTGMYIWVFSRCDNLIVPCFVGIRHVPSPITTLLYVCDALVAPPHTGIPEERSARSLEARDTTTVQDGETFGEMLHIIRYHTAYINPYPYP
jgi:hypothetical protein